MTKKDNSKECGNKDFCDGGMQCLEDNGRNEYCKKCECKNCIYGKCQEDA